MTTRIEVKEVGNVEKLLQQMPIELREKQLNRAIRKAGAVVVKEAKRLAPPPGYPGDLPGKPPLNKSIKTRIRRYGDRIAGFIGPDRKNGAHGHLVEFGHAITRTTPGPTMTRRRPFLRPAADSTQREQQSAIIKTLQDLIKTWRA